MADPPKLPRDILMEIISRLPIETILRCRCVSKFWYSLINDPSFIDMQLRYHSSMSNFDSNRFFIMNYRSEISRREHYSVRSGETFSEHMKLDFPFAETFRVVDSCNGILCLSRLSQDPFSREIVLWNPSIKRSKALVEIEEKEEHDPHSHPHFELAIGFGYIPLINDFKVVHMVSHGETMSVFPSISSYFIHVYNLKQDSWRRTKVLPSCFPNHVFPKALVKNTAHWMSSRENVHGYRQELILSFDLEKETFSEFQLPRFECGCREPFISVLAYGETLSLFHHCVGGQEQWEMWVMAEYGVAETWVKHVVIRQGEILFPLGFLNGGEVVLVTRTNQVVAYEPDSRQIRDLHLYGMMDVFRAVTYTGSLALLNNDRGN